MTDVLTRLTTSLAHRYVIERELGAGGMATVYLAHDVRHDRKVALKVLKPELSAILGAERFLKEIRTTANLQHPHILPLHDSGEAEGTVFYVMPYVEGESLRDRLEREQQLPVEDAVRIAREVLDALAYAHTQGVIHRDIKPENILLYGGHALVADFGIALAASRSEGSKRLTETGMSLGTPAYMAPEQAMGDKAITPKVDLYAVGCVLYEMLSGEPPFTGPTAQAIVARVMTEEPRALTLHRHTIPPHVEAAVRAALEKLPADRFATAAEFAAALGSGGVDHGVRHASFTAPGTDRRSPRGRLRDPVFLGLAAVAGIALAALALAPRRPDVTPPRPVRFLFSGSDSAPITNNIPWPAAIAPDGATLVYTAATRSGRHFSATGELGMLYVRRIDQLEGRPIPGTVGATQPVFSPDGQWIAFEADGKEKKVRLDGSAPVTIATGGFNNGADWTSRGELVVGATGAARGLSKVSVAGGELVAFTHPDSARGELFHLWPVALSDGRAVVFTVWHGALASSELALGSLTGRVWPLGIRGIRPLAVLDGAVVYLQADGAVMAVGLDAARHRARGTPVPVLDPVPVDAANNGNSGVFISRGGAQVSALLDRSSQLMWVGRDGTARPVAPDIGNFANPRLSPDGRRIAVLVAAESRSDVWIYELEAGTLSRLTTDGGVVSAEWSGDGRQVIYAAGGVGTAGGIWAQEVGTAAPPRELARPSNAPYAVLAPDARSLLVESLGEETSDFDVLLIPLDSGATARRYASGPGWDVAPRFSPNGRWVALSSQESGQWEIYVRSFPDPAVKVQVSVGGGRAPMWSRDGTRLFYYEGTSVVGARLRLDRGVAVLSRDTVFRGIARGASPYHMANFDVSGDGSRLLVPVPQSDVFQLVVVPNWLTEFRERMAAGAAGGQR